MIVAFCGERGAGKDTACQALRCYGFHQLAFADPLREVCKTVFGLTDTQMSDRVLKETPLDKWPFMSPRMILKLVGTEGFRDNFPGVWINALCQQAEKHNRVTVSDTRFQDEATAIKEMGGIMVRIDNPSIVPSGDRHRSELEWQSFDYDAVITNDFTSAEDFRVHVAMWWSEYSKLRAPA